jgi:hypothetical protein
MQCRACNQQERASEGYPCVSCGTFICLRCTFKGVVRCAACEAKVQPAQSQVPPAPKPTPKNSWPEH